VSRFSRILRVEKDQEEIRMRRWTRLLGLLPIAAFSQQMDMEAMAKWGAADVVRYHIVGVYQGTSYVAGDGSGQADFSDRVVIDLGWKLSEARMVGAATFQNTKSTARKLRDREPACLPPVLQGELEFYELLAVKEGVGGAINLVAKSTYPAVDVAQSCTASRRTVPGKVADRTQDFMLPSPVLFAMPLRTSENLAVSADKKSLIFKKDGWVWTLTPSIPAR
jgi:hypothetical protein